MQHQINQKGNIKSNHGWGICMTVAGNFEGIVKLKTTTKKHMHKRSL